MKIEFLHHWRKARGLGLKERVIAALPRWAPWAARVPWLANARDTLPGAAWLTERIAGLAEGRSLPRWRSDTFLRRFSASAVGDAADVVLFVDTFSNYFEPENAEAALAVLRAAGYRVHVARPADGGRPLCCGRTWLAAGCVDEAKEEARRVVAALAPHVARGAAIVGLEPSCLLGMRDEFLVMGLGDVASQLARRAFMVEEFLAHEHREGRLRVRFAPQPPTPVLLHGHCHQKAFDVLGATETVLRLVPGYDVRVIETGCCGMAGSFGFEAAHFDVSTRMAELALLPAVRAAPADALVVADGTSCRHQIADGTKASEPREAVHVVRALERALARG